MAPAPRSRAVGPCRKPTDGNRASTARGLAARRGGKDGPCRFGRRTAEAARRDAPHDPSDSREANDMPNGGDPAKRGRRERLELPLGRERGSPRGGADARGFATGHRPSPERARRSGPTLWSGASNGLSNAPWASGPFSAGDAGPERPGPFLTKARNGAGNGRSIRLPFRRSAVPPADHPDAIRVMGTASSEEPRRGS
jgi:hypothetical protein